MRTKEAQRLYQLEWMKKRRQAWIDSQGGACNECGSTDQLEVDHVDPATKSMQPTAIWSRKESVRVEELAKCQVLCHDCHLDKTLAAVTWTHGRTGYSKGCRCEVCYNAQKAHSAQRTMPQ